MKKKFINKLAKLAIRKHLSKTLVSLTPEEQQRLYLITVVIRNELNLVLK